MTVPQSSARLVSDISAKVKLLAGGDNANSSGPRPTGPSFIIVTLYLKEILKFGRVLGANFPYNRRLSLPVAGLDPGSNLGSWKNYLFEPTIIFAFHCIKNNIF